jgi:tetrapyrrole methylase family protein / MazG family protein
MSGITIVGLGPGHIQHLTREAWEALSTAPAIYLRTAQHPLVADLPSDIPQHSFDDIYETTTDFSQVYETIAERVLDLGARSEGVVYAVPGHPCVGEATVGLIRAQAEARGLSVRLVPGLSFVEPVLAALGLDALPSLQIADALDLAARHHPPFHPDAPTLIAQLYSATIASDVKLTLMNQYPDDHPVTLIHAAGTPDERLERLPLFEIDRSSSIVHLTVLFIPPLTHASAFESLQETVAHLRAPEGCPWDREQTHQSLRANLLEETYEVLATLDADQPQAMREEFGDLLLQVVLHSQIALEAGEFSMADVIATLQSKLIRRHPHVFGEAKVSGVGEVLENWEKLKAQERNEAAKSGKQSQGVLGTIPAGLPALIQADTYQRRAARVGFDWPDISGVKAKVHEEIAEVEATAEPAELEDEIGDLLFAVVNWARWLEIDPEAALRRANAKFASRFAQVEAAVQAQGKEMHALTLPELDRLWEEAKKA